MHTIRQFEKRKRRRSTLEPFLARWVKNRKSPAMNRPEGVSLIAVTWGTAGSRSLGQTPRHRDAMVASLNASEPNMNTKISELSLIELDRVTGGMNLDGYRESSNVVDARGGQSTFLFWRISYDAQGHISDVSLK
jgi:hypothetical protein